MSKNHSVIATHHASIERLFNMFNKRITRDVVDQWSQELQQYDHKTVEDSVKFLFKTAKFFPSFSELKAKCQEIAPVKTAEEKRENEILEKRKVEQQKYQLLKEGFVKACIASGKNPQEMLRNLVLRWWEARTGASYAPFGDLTLASFEQCALFDLEKSKRLNRSFEDVARS